jgi:hypothetical protein
VLTSRRIAVALWLAYLVVPVDGWGLFPGRPLGALPLVVLSAVCWLAFAGESIAGPVLMATALAAKLALGLVLIVPHGFVARYYANASFAAPVERSLDSMDRSFTRIDPQLRFGVGDARDLPLEFFNDTQFNYYKDTEPDRQTLPFSVVWSGVWRVERDGPQMLYVRAPSGAVDISFDAREPLRVDARDWRGTVTLPPGQHRVLIAWSVPQGGARQFEAGQVIGGAERPLGGAEVTRRPAGGAALLADRVVRTVSALFDAVLVAWVFLATVITLGAAYRDWRRDGSERNALAIAWFIGLADAFVFAVPSFGRSVTLSGGDDWLTYETLARDIGLNGMWMTWGEALGHGRTFYAQPLYPYFLAACHWLLGADLAGIYFVQRLSVAVTAILLWRTSARLFGEHAARAVLVVAILVVYGKLANWSGILLSENLFVPIVCLWVFTLTRLMLNDEPAIGDALLAGVVGGLATLTRQSMMLGWLVVVPMMVVVARGPRRWMAIAVLVASMVGVTSLATIRNWVVARQVVLVTSEGGVVLAQGNPVPSELAIPAAHRAQYARLGLDALTQRVVEFARQRPGAFAAGLWRKARFALGWFDLLLSGSGTSLFYIAVWVAAIAGVIALPRVVAPDVPPLVALLGVALAAAHFAVVVAFVPYVYGDRLIVPFYVLLVPYAAIPFVLLARVVGGERERRVWPFVLGLGVSGVAALQAAGFLPAIDLPLLAVAALVAGLCASRPAEAGRLLAAASAVYALALVGWLFRVPLLGTASACRVEWLFLALAVFWPPLMERPQSWSLGRAAAAIPRFAGAMAYGVAAALAIGALFWLGCRVDPSRALLRGRLAAYGSIGTAAYVAVWMCGWWPSARAYLPTRAVQGALLGLFAAAVIGVELGGHAAGVLTLAGLGFGAGRVAEYRPA